MTDMEMLHDRYALEQPLGSGGTATTWRATDTRTGKPVTVKRLSTPVDPLGQDADRETKVLSQLDHPQIPSFVDAFVETWRMQGYLHLVLEFIEGQPLTEVLAARRFDQDQARDLIDDVLGTVAWLHNLAPPVIHRDIKPSNVVMRPDGRLALIDFGLATDAVDRTFQHTMAVGTLGYQAPEQIAGDPRPASDVYSVGVLALEVLTRVPPNEMLSGQTLEWEGRAAHLSPRWRAWLERTLDPDPASRFANAPEALAALREPGPAKNQLQPPAVTAPSSGRTGMVVGAGLLVLVTLVAAAMGWMMVTTSPTPTTDAPLVNIAAPPAPAPPAPVTEPSGRSTQAAASACRAGESAACLQAAEALAQVGEDGTVPEVNRRLGESLLGTACLFHHPKNARACLMRAKAEPLPKDALRWWVEACLLEAEGACAEADQAAAASPATAVDPLHERLILDCLAKAAEQTTGERAVSCAMSERWAAEGFAAGRLPPQE